MPEGTVSSRSKESQFLVRILAKSHCKILNPKKLSLVNNLKHPNFTFSNFVTNASKKNKSHIKYDKLESVVVTINNEPHTVYAEYIWIKNKLTIKISVEYCDSEKYYHKVPLEFEYIYQLVQGELLYASCDYTTHNRASVKIRYSEDLDFKLNSTRPCTLKHFKRRDWRGFYNSEIEYHSKTTRCIFMISPSSPLREKIRVSVLNSINGVLDEQYIFNS